MSHCISSSPSGSNCENITTAQWYPCFSHQQSHVEYFPDLKWNSMTFSVPYHHNTSVLTVTFNVDLDCICHTGSFSPCEQFDYTQKSVKLHQSQRTNTNTDPHRYGLPKMICKKLRGHFVQWHSSVTIHLSLSKRPSKRIVIDSCETTWLYYSYRPATRHVTAWRSFRRMWKGHSSWRCCRTHIGRVLYCSEPRARGCLTFSLC